MCDYPYRECPFCENGYIIDNGVIPVYIIAYQSGDVFWGCKLDQEKESSR